MSLPNILLGLIKEPTSGYDIKQVFEQALRYFWNADLAQIYPALKKLEHNGLATSQIAEPDKGPAKKLYQRTNKGEQQLREWLLQGPQLNVEKLHYMTQVFFLGEIPIENRVDFFNQLRSYIRQQLDELIDVDQGWANDDPNYPDHLSDKEQAMQFTLRLGLGKYQAIIEWCDSCLTTLQKTSSERNQ